jgi:hypothetical protein
MMACNWDIHYSDKPDPETGRIECRCEDCGNVKSLHCDRDFETGQLIVQVETCDEMRAKIAAQMVA